jgi:hypothetical protein
MTIRRPPRESTDSFQDRKWKEYVVDSVQDIEQGKLPGTVATTNGNQTINKACGAVIFAAGATTLTVTNSLVTADSLVFVSILTNDATAALKHVLCSAGSFVITLSAAPTGATKVGFLVVTAV